MGFGVRAGVLVALAIASGGPSAGAQEEKIAPARARLRAAPDDVGAALALGKALRRAGRATDAAQELERAATKARRVDAPALRWEAMLGRLDARDLERALAGCKAMDPALGAACRAEVHLAQNRASLARPEAERALALDASLYEGRVALARALAFEGRVAEAEALLRAAITAVDGRPEGHRRLGELLVADGRREAGLAELRRARVADADDPALALDLAAALGSTREAREALEAATRARPGLADAHAALARVALDLGDAAAGKAAAREALRLDAASAAGHVALGRAFVIERAWAEALREAEAARKLLPMSAAAELVAADALAGKGELDLAIDGYQKAAALDRGDPTPLVRAAGACLGGGRGTTARGFADKVTADHPRWGPGWVVLGDVLSAAGEKAAAVGAWEKALAADGPVDREAVARRIAGAK
jgi:tetratricopeptide (TPR) repeat protein